MQSMALMAGRVWSPNGSRPRFCRHQMPKANLSCLVGAKLVAGMGRVSLSGGGRRFAAGGRRPPLRLLAGEEAQRHDDIDQFRQQEEQADVVEVVIEPAGH